MTEFLDVIKDISSIWTRLFEHRVFLVGEIQFSLQEYQQKRDDVEVAQLFSLLENIDEIKITQIDRLKENINTQLAKSRTCIKQALSIANEIEDLEKLNQQVEIPNTQEREIDWNKFVESVDKYFGNIESFNDETEADICKTFLP